MHVPGPSSASFARPVRALSGQRNPSHGPCAFCQIDYSHRIVVGLWLLLFAAGTSVVWPAPRLLQQRQRGFRGIGRRARRDRRPRPNGYRPADLCRSLRHDSERPGADHRAAVIVAATPVAQPSPDCPLAIDQSQRNLIALLGVPPRSPRLAFFERNRGERGVTRRGKGDGNLELVNSQAHGRRPVGIFILPYEFGLASAPAFPPILHLRRLRSHPR